MMSKPLNKHGRLLSSAALVVALVVFIIWSFYARQPVIQVLVDEKVCYFVEPDFQLRWIHSVEKQWWEEQYHRESDGLLLTTTYFQAFGAGTPSTEALAEVQKPGYIGYQINENFPNLNWVVSRLTQGEIDYADHRVMIHQLVPDYSEVTITPKAYSLIDRLTKDLCHELKDDGTK